MNNNLQPKFISEIINRMEEISITLMDHEKKNFCLAKIHPNEWRIASFTQASKDNIFIIVPSPAFTRLILDREYLTIVDKFPFNFGTGNDWDVVKALKQADRFRYYYSDQDFFNYIRSETMAYVFKISDDYTVSDRILRLDLCRNINNRGIFQGGIFHVFKHFTPEGYNTISSHVREYKIETFSEIYQNIIINFYSNDITKEKGNCYVATSKLKDGHKLRGVYYKENEIPVSFINSIRID